MKIQWMSNSPWACTGYGVQTKIFTPRIKALGHDVNIFAFYGLEGGVLKWHGMNVFPRHAHIYGQDIVSSHAESTNRQVIISLMDAWVFQSSQIKNKNIKWIPWFPIDSEPIPGPVGDSVRTAYKRIVFSKFGERMTNDAGMDCYYVPHGVETNIYKPLDMAECREKQKLPKDAFIIGMVAANKGNPPRKAFYAHLQAFAEFKRRHPDAFLYLHTNSGEHGEYQSVNLPAFAAFLGLERDKDYAIANNYRMAVGGYNDQDMVELYNSFDVHLLVSMGEGFGVPILEAQSCGCPVIVGDWTAMSELCFSGYMVDKKDADPWFTDLGAYQWNPRAYAIVDKLEAMYKRKGNQNWRRRAREGALAYDADLVTEKYWKPVLEEIEANLPEATKNMVAKFHTHSWSKTGLWNKDGTISVPCEDPKCMDELIFNLTTNAQNIVVKGFNLSPNGIDLDIEDDPTGSVAKIVCREIERDYDLDLDFKDGDIVIDIGAQVGIVSCYLGKKYPNIKILAFEPVKGNYDRLMRNIKENAINNVATFDMAITGDGRDICMSGNVHENSGSCNIYGDTGENVKSLTLKNIFDTLDIDRVKLLKIDCEGAEYEILEAFPELLDRIDAIRGEIHPMEGKSQSDLMLYIKDHIKDVKMTVLT
jgi:FkbM family methyltransferase